MSAIGEPGEAPIADRRTTCLTPARAARLNTRRCWATASGPSRPASGLRGVAHERSDGEAGGESIENGAAADLPSRPRDEDGGYASAAFLGSLEPPELVLSDFFSDDFDSPELSDLPSEAPAFDRRP
jgi:hypothetical protein